MRLRTILNYIVTLKCKKQNKTKKNKQNKNHHMKVMKIISLANFCFKIMHSGYKRNKKYILIGRNI